ncbi:MAG: pyridoxamine 5'-phosphate oxidase [Paracoccaceae bacterium]
MTVAPAHLTFATERPTGAFEADDPYALARAWLGAAEASEPEDHNAMALATVDVEGLPNLRVVLLKEIEDDPRRGGFVFYTNYDSAKGQELATTPRAAANFHWKSLRRQLRLRGTIERIEPERADAYYASRPRPSRSGAWASRQSRPLESREALTAEVERFSAELPDDPPRPGHWGGYRLRPVEVEFWADGAYRLHDRFRWTRTAPDASEWRVARLNP